MINKDKTPPRKAEEKGQESKERFLITEGIDFKEFSEKIGLKTRDLLEKLNRMGYVMNAGDLIDKAIIPALSKLSGKNIIFQDLEDHIRETALQDKSKLITKAPVIAIMGHVDHGKTTLLDSIRKSNIVSREAGGITQHIGAYRTKYKNHVITFIDTPGHEAFTQLRSRGAHLTDIVILVVAADDGVMPQTKEAISHARAAGVPIIVAINKIDKADADIDKVKQTLSKEGLLVEDWGGDTVSVAISAKEGTNMEVLLEMILLVSEMSELKANPEVPAQGIVLEARLDAQKGPTATVIIQHGTLRQGESFVCGAIQGKARALFNESGKAIKEAGPADPVEVIGFTDVPAAGDIFQVVPDPESAKKISQFRLAKKQREEDTQSEHFTLDQLFQQIEEDGIKELPLIIKADVHGSVEVLSDILPNLSTDKVQIKIIHSATGKISETDIILASASKAIVIGYNTKPSQKVLAMAKEEGVEIRVYSVIYHLLDDIKKAIIGLLDPVIIEKFLGRAEVRRVFYIPKIGSIAGCLVTEGKISRNAEIRLIRADEVIHKGRLSSLKHLKENVTEIKKDYECGIGIEGFRDIQEGDTIEAYVKEKTKPI